MKNQFHLIDDGVHLYKMKLYDDSSTKGHGAYFNQVLISYL